MIRRLSIPELKMSSGRNGTETGRRTDWGNTGLEGKGNTGQHDV